MLNRLSIAVRLTLTTMLSLALLALTFIGLSYNFVAAEMERQAIERQETSMKVAWQVLREAGTEFRREGDTLYAGSVALNGNEAIVDRVKEIVGGTATIFMGDTRITTNVMKPDGSGRAVGTQLAKNAAYEAVLEKGQPYRGTADILGNTFYTGYDPIKNAAGETIGILYVGVKRADFFAAVDALVMRLGLAALVATALLTLMTVAVIRWQMAPLARIRTALEGLGQGKRDVAIVDADRKDEIGLMARTLEVFKQSLSENEQLQARQKELAATAEAERRRTLETLVNEFQTSVGQIIDSVTASAQEMRVSAEMMSGRSVVVSERVRGANDASERTSSNVQAVAAATEELSASVAEISRQVAETSSAAQGAVLEAQQTSESVKSLAEAAQRIGQVVGLISDIAAQTNLLALNATIEAARAGDAGRGFAVVAAEVKDLASQTAKATTEIQSQVNNIQTETERAVKVITGITSRIDEISQMAMVVASAVEEQGAATQEIARNVLQASNETGEVMNQIAGASGAVGEAGAASAQVHDTATALSQRAEQLKRMAMEFVARVRAA